MYKLLYVLYERKSRDDSSNLVRLLLFTSYGKLYQKAPLPQRYGIPKAWLLERAEYEFEGHKIYGTKDYDAYLTFMFGDYMTPPPEEERVSHAPVSSYFF